MLKQIIGNGFTMKAGQEKLSQASAVVSALIATKSLSLEAL
jgi:hypothetical protein